MATFSWSDTVRAVFGPCLPCLPSPRDHEDANNNDGNGQQSMRREELESLLQGAEFSDAEMDADALSLHSHLGRRDGHKRVKKKRGRNKGSITLFGFDLFGRPLQADDQVEEGDPEARRRRSSRISSSTLDSDAAPLADDVIAQLSAQTQARWEADELRKSRKQSRKQRKEAALLGAQDDTFEGFPGSGSGSGAAPDEFGAFQQGVPANTELEFVHVQGGGAEEAHEDADADFDASSYVRTTGPRSDSGSGTRSRTSVSDQASVPAHRVPLPPSSASSTPPAPLSPAKAKRSKKKRSNTTESSRNSDSQPRSPTGTPYVPRVDIASPTFEGFPEDEGFDGNAARPFGFRLAGESVHGELEGNFPSPGLHSPGGTGFRKDFPSPGLGRSSGFPSPGLGGRKNSLSMSGSGAFLARTGDDD